MLAGMANRQLRISRTLSRLGMITSESGLAAMHSLMAWTTTQTVPVIGIVPKEYWSGLLANITSRPGVFSSLDIKTPQRSPTRATGIEHMPVLYSSEPVPNRLLTTYDVEALIRRLVQDILGTATVVPDEPLANQGLDSLARLELVQKVQVNAGSERS